MSTPPKYPSTPHWPWSQTVHRDDSYHKDPEFFLNKEVVVTEKLDGGNTCLFDGEVYARSVQAPSHDGWMAMARKHHAWKLTLSQEGYAMYGEDLFGIHSIEYEPVEEDKTFYLFSILCTPHFDYSSFLSWNNVLYQASRYHFETVPVVFNGVFRDLKHVTGFFETEIAKGSKLGGECEGFVMRIADQFYYRDFSKNVCKYVRPNHVQTDEHWRKNWQSCKLKR